MIDIMHSAHDQVDPPSRLAAFCGAAIEAVWLAAICVVPLLLNPQSPEAAYQPFKYGFLRVLAVVGAAAWVVRAVELKQFRNVGAGSLASIRQAPWLILLLLFAVLVAISTAFSVCPGASFWGAYETFQGALTYGAELVLAALIARHLQTSDQVERFVTLLLVTSFAVSIFAILQGFGWDPRYPKIVADRVFATAGHPIYLAGYLLMSVPLTLYRLFSLRGRPREDGARAVALAFYSTVLTAQLAAFFCAESRGPILALGATLFALGILYAACRRWKYAVGIAGAAALLLLATLMLGGGALKGLGNIPGLKRFALTTPGQGVEFFRAEIWKQAPSIIFAAEPLPHPTGSVDRSHILRPWIGYGPETLDCVLPIHYTVPNNPDNVIENRFHNLVWDLWFSIGAAGLFVFLALIVFLFFQSYRRLGFIDSRASAAAFWVCSILSSLAAVLFFAGFFGVGFTGVGLVGGLLGGVLLFACLSNLRTSGESRRRPSTVDILLLALLAAIAGHMVDTASAFPSAPTAVLFWSYLGVALAILRGVGDEARDEEKAKKPARVLPSTKTGSVSSLAPAMMIGLGLVALLTSTLHQYRYQAFGIGTVLSGSLFNPGGAANSHSLLLVVVVLYWLSAVAFYWDIPFATSNKAFGRNIVWTLIMAAAVGFFYALARSQQIVTIGPLPGIMASESAVLGQARGYDQLFVSEMVVLLLGTVAIAWSLIKTPENSTPPVSRRGWVTALVMLVLASIGCWEIAIKPLRADIYAGWAKAIEGANRSLLSFAPYGRAMAINPRPFIYRARFGDALIAKAEATPDVIVARNYFAQAEQVLLAAREISDLNRASLYLGQLYRVWSARESGAAKTELESKSAGALREACAFEPHNEAVTNLSAAAEKNVAGHSGDRAR